MLGILTRILPHIGFLITSRQQQQTL